MKYISFILFGTWLVTSCKSDKPNPKTENPTISSVSSSNVIVVNEGNFQFNNSSITYLNGLSGQITSDVFKPANNRDLGDVGQSATFWNNKMYVVVNNSGKIEVLNSSNFKSLATITGMVSPRYFLPVGNSKAYVSDYSSNKISVIDLKSNTITKTIPCAGWTERMIYHLGKVYVTNYWQPYLFVIDPVTDQKTDSIFIGKGANSIVSDQYDRLIIACGGFNIAQSDSKIVFLNTYNRKVEKEILFDKDAPNEIEINATKDSIYFLKTDLYKIGIDESTIQQPFVKANARWFYRIGIDTRSNLIYVSDAVDFVQKGKVYIYSATATELGKFDAGIIPGNFCFY